jgi:DNA invertase Pin-like site-specific DNA recombinase
LRERAQLYGWEPDAIRVIDCDLGLTGRTAAGRPGFQELVTLVDRQQVGIIFAYDVTRLARNCTDWYQLLDLCGFRQCLVGDQEGVYDPATPNGRLLLGLKGLIAELELSTLRARLTAGVLNKAQRGELALILPTGLVRDPSGQVVKHPDQEVQSRLDLVFATFLRLRSITQVVRYLGAHDLRLPRRNYAGDISWRPATIRMVTSILHNPAYAGAFAYGRTRSHPQAAAPPRRRVARLPRAEWKICLPDRYPGYIDWATFEAIQTMIGDNYSEYQHNQARGVPRGGAALLHGLVYCGVCGHKLRVRYSKRVRYICNVLSVRYQIPVCQWLPAEPIDAYVVGAFFEALSAVELDICAQVLAATDQEQAQLHRAHQQQLERLRYQARLAERQYQKADPDNRLVTAELEKRWEVALQALHRAEADEQLRAGPPQPPRTVSPALREAFADVARGIPQLWEHGTFSRPQQKALLRCLIDKVVLQRSAPDLLQVRIVWRGGETTTTEIPLAVRSLACVSGGPELERLAVELAGRGQADAAIAAELTRRGYRSPRASTVMPATVRGIRLKHGVYRPRPGSRPRDVPGQLTLPQMARQLKVAKHWLYQRIERGQIEVPFDPERKLYLFPNSTEARARLEDLKAGRCYHVRL